MPCNNTGSELIVGPDENGEFFSVLPGEEYELPAALEHVKPEDRDPSVTQPEDTAATPPPPPPQGPQKKTPEQQSGDTASTESDPA